MGAGVVGFGREFRGTTDLELVVTFKFVQGFRAGLACTAITSSAQRKQSVIQVGEGFSNPTTTLFPITASAISTKLSLSLVGPPSVDYWPLLRNTNRHFIPRREKHLQGRGSVVLSLTYSISPVTGLLGIAGIPVLIPSLSSLVARSQIHSGQFLVPSEHVLIPWRWFFCKLISRSFPCVHYTHPAFHVPTLSFSFHSPRALTLSSNTLFISFFIRLVLISFL